MICPQCSTENASNAKQCFRCGGALPTDAIPTPEAPPLAQSPARPAYDLTSSGVASAPPVPGAADPSAVPYAPPGYYPGQPPMGGYPPQNGPPYPQAYAAPYTPEPNIIDSIVPTHNPKALTGYYMAVFSVIPLLGILLGIGGFVLGIMGLKEANRNPAIKGKAHAWVAIIVGGFFGFGYLALVVLGIVVALLPHPGSQ